jgi:hypothetical protein
MNSFYEHHKESIRWHYRCVDRILLNGLIQPFQQPERVVGFFNCSSRRSSFATTSSFIAARHWTGLGSACLMPIEQSDSPTRSPCSSVTRSASTIEASCKLRSKLVQSSDPQPLRQRLYQAVRSRSLHRADRNRRQQRQRLWREQMSAEPTGSPQYSQRSTTTI